MEDKEIINLLTARNENGMSELKAKYSRLILKVCRGFLRLREDAEECANDAMLAVWEKIPPDDPENLTAYICKIARRKAVDKLRYNKAAMRDTDLLTELDECLPSKYSPETEAEKAELAEILNSWVKTLDEKKRKMFVLRYFYMYSAKETAKSCSMSCTAVTTALSRLRRELKKYLNERGISYE